MKIKLPALLALAFTTLQLTAFAQPVTGVWEGRMRDEFIQINIMQKGDLLCGFTYDYVVNERSNHCVAKFEGKYSKEDGVYFLQGKLFIENSGSHVLMRITLWRDKEYGKNVLIGKVYTGSFLGVGGDVIKVQKVSSNPQPIDPGFEPCFPKPTTPPITRTPAPKPPVTSTPAPTTPKPKPTTPPVVAKPAPTTPAVDTPVAQPRPKEPVKPLASNRSIEENMKGRRRTEQSHLEVDVKKINLKVYDNGIVDDDTVSIFFNGKLLISHQRLSAEPIELNIELDEKIGSNEITMFAENLGSIPPNTALIVITAGGKRYELRSKADLQQNAVLVIDYKPRE